jgi:hypothetical protein
MRISAENCRLEYEIESVSSMPSSGCSLNVRMYACFRLLEALEAVCSKEYRIIERKRGNMRPAE